MDNIWQEKKRRSIFQNTNFLKLWTSQILSQFTVYLINFIFINKIFEITKSPIAISLVWLFSALPTILLSAISGYFVDLWDKRKILIITNFLQAIIIASTLFVENRSYHFLYIIIFAYSLLNQFYLPAEGTSIPWLVEREALTTANSLFLITGQSSFILGFGMGGIFVKLFTEKYAILIGSVFLIIASLVTFFLPPEKEKTKKPNFLQFIDKEIKRGWEFIAKRERLVMFSLGLISLFQVVTVILSVILPTLAEQILKKNFSEISSLLIFSLGAGLITGSLIFPKINHFFRKSRLISFGLISVSVCLLIIPTIILEFIKLKTMILSILLFWGGLTAIFIIIPAQTFIQETTPNNLRGRIMGILGVLITLSAILPAIVVAGLLELIGVVKFIFVLGISLLFFSLFILKKGNAIIATANNRA